MKGNGVKKQSMASKMVAAIGSMFAPKVLPQIKPSFGRSSRYRTVGPKRPAGSKIARAIRRGNHGHTNKSGTMGKYFELKKRNEYLSAKGLPTLDALA